MVLGLKTIHAGSFFKVKTSLMDILYKGGYKLIDSDWI